MKKIMKWMLGLVSLIAFFFVLDASGIGFRKHLKAVKDYAEGKSKHLRFIPVGWKQSRK